MSPNTSGVKPAVTSHYAPSAIFTNLLAKKGGELTQDDVFKALAKIVNDDKSLSESAKAAELAKYVGDFEIPAKRFPALAEALGGSKYLPKDSWYPDVPVFTDDDATTGSWPEKNKGKRPPSDNFTFEKGDTIKISKYVTYVNAALKEPPKESTPVAKPTGVLPTFTIGKPYSELNRP